MGGVWVGTGYCTQCMLIRKSPPVSKYTSLSDTEEETDATAWFLPCRRERETSHVKNTGSFGIESPSEKGRTTAQHPYYNPTAIPTTDPDIRVPQQLPL